MRRAGKIFLIATAIAFAIFFANVMAGAFWNARFLSDIQEMLMLSLTSLLFVVAMILFEQSEKEKGNDHTL